MDSQLTNEQREEITRAIYAGQKIQAIKLFRDATNCGLAEAKAFIDELEQALRKEHPESFQSPAAAGCGTGLILLLLLPPAAVGTISWIGRLAAS